MPKLSRRDLFAVVTIAALALGWAVDRTRQAAKAHHWRTEAIKTMSWVDQNCAWVDVGLTEENEIVFLREPLPAEREAFERELKCRAK